VGGSNVTPCGVGIGVGNGGGTVPRHRPISHRSSIALSSWVVFVAVLHEHAAPVAELHRERDGAALDAGGRRPSRPAPTPGTRDALPLRARILPSSK